MKLKRRHLGREAGERDNGVAPAEKSGPLSG